MYCTCSRRAAADSRPAAFLDGGACANPNLFLQSARPSCRFVSLPQEDPPATLRCSPSDVHPSVSHRGLRTGCTGCTIFSSSAVALPQGESAQSQSRAAAALVHFFDPIGHRRPWLNAAMRVQMNLRCHQRANISTPLLSSIHVRPPLHSSCCREMCVGRRCGDEDTLTVKPPAGRLRGDFERKPPSIW